MKWKFYIEKEFVIKTENKPGTLHAIASLLGSKGINIEAISAYTSNEKIAYFRLVTADPSSTEKALKTSPVVLDYEMNDVIIVTLDNKPGELAKLTEVLYKEGVDLNAVYILRADKKTDVVINSVDNKKVMGVLSGI